jgi:hypothetical protein
VPCLPLPGRPASRARATSALGWRTSGRDTRELLARCYKGHARPQAGKPIHLLDRTPTKA